jgi:hypothetical protein
MKKILFAFILLLSINSIAQSNIATVKKIQGILVFSDNEPIANYLVYGEVSISSTEQLERELQQNKGQYQTVRDYLIKKTRLSNSQADGLILYLINGGIDKALVIKFKENETNINQARVNNYQGISTFIDCEPTNKYEYLGSVKSVVNFTSGQYQPVRDNLIRKTKKEFKNANGLILKLVPGGADNGDAILLKD